MVQSSSNSYGVPGLRLGVLASGDTEIIYALKKDVAIWNINSFAEFYMQIEEKYKKDYAQSLDRIRAERARFRAKLERLPNLRVIPSQANYLMVPRKAETTVWRVCWSRALVWSSLCRVI